MTSETLEISWSNKDYYGKRIPHKNRSQIYRVRKWHQRIRVSNAAERNLALALQVLNEDGAKLGIPKDIKESAALIYRKAVEKNLIRGRSIESIVCAAIYASCRMINIPRTLDEISKVSEVNKKKIGKAYRHLAKELSLNLKPTTPYSYISQFCNKLDLDKQVIMDSEHIIRLAGESIFSNLPKTINAWENHNDEIKNLQDEYVLCASSDTCEVQAYYHKTKDVFAGMPCLNLHHFL